MYWGLGPIELGLGATHIRLSPAWLGATTMIDPHFFLMLAGLSARRPSGVRYDVYLTHGDTPPATLLPSQRAGELDFGAGDARFDVSSILRQWPMDAEDLTLSILACSAPNPHAAPTIGTLAIVI